ncbi:MAG: hypothetical protein L6V93_08455 [Clostridiales bacterium]|nr:MAG: hypothetical protein L6V93_08455 [Clostridiales bacterium]
MKYYTYLDAMTGETVDVKDLMFESRGGMGDKQSAAMGMLSGDTKQCKIGKRRGFVKRRTGA